MWTGLWQKRSKFTETNTAIAYEQHGFFEQAQTAFEQVNPLLNTKFKNKMVVAYFVDILQMKDM
jgi:hypothetical protein